MKPRFSLGTNKYNNFVSLYINIGMVFEMLSAFFIIIRGDIPGFQTILQKGFIVFLLICSMILLLWKPPKLLFLLSSVWIALHIIAFLLEPRITILLRRIIIYSYGYVVLLACLIANIDNINAFLDALKPYALICLPYCVFQILAFRKTGIYSMQFSYGTVLSAMLFLLWGREKKRYYLAFALILLTDLYCGSRGCMICFSIAIILNELLLGKRGLRFLAISFLFLFAVLVAFNISSIASFILRFLPGSRTLSYFAEGDFFHLSGREKYYAVLWDKIFQTDFSIHGLYSDRFVMANYHGRRTMEEIYGSYAHNIVVEVIYQFGWLGIPVLLSMFLWLVSSFIKVNRLKERSLAIIWISAVSFCVGQLLVSSSYLTAVSSGECLGVLLLTDRYYKKHKRISSLTEKAGGIAQQ